MAGCSLPELPDYMFTLQRRVNKMQIHCTELACAYCLGSLPFHSSALKPLCSRPMWAAVITLKLRCSCSQWNGFCCCYRALQKDKYRISWMSSEFTAWSSVCRERGLQFVLQSVLSPSHWEAGIYPTYLPLSCWQDCTRLSISLY